ncbi:hypothetical protein LIER_35646 [Lithospermum erythrorhizon]|uniref:Reverse transcriptase Ty1/copia-type domain-containing protein n=1 Tax=Lithospermum erythrorhizon TaxID=34254 RepID=A0AAV3NWP5_LITER
MEAEFEMSRVGELKYFLGFQINQIEDSIFISQSKYAKNIVKKFEMETSKPKRTPFATHVKVTKDETRKFVDISGYKSMIGRLLYLTTSRLHIAHSVGVCARYQADPKDSHLNLVKRIIKYIQVVNLEHVSTDKQVADILTKGLDVNQFEYLSTALGLFVLDK